VSGSTDTIGDRRGVGSWPAADHSLTTNARVLAITAGYRVIVASLVRQRLATCWYFSTYGDIASI